MFVSRYGSLRKSWTVCENIWCVYCPNSSPCLTWLLSRLVSAWGFSTINDVAEISLSHWNLSAPNAPSSFRNTTAWIPPCRCKDTSESPAVGCQKPVWQVTLIARKTVYAQITPFYLITREEYDSEGASNTKVYPYVAGYGGEFFKRNTAQVMISQYKVHYDADSGSS